MLTEIYTNNEKILKKAQTIHDLLEQAMNDGISTLDDIINYGNARLYYMCTASMNVQKKSPMGEKFLCKLLGYTSVPSSEDRGDAVDDNGVYYEFKNSFTNSGQNLNIRQIRLWQDVDYYYCFYINEEDLDKSVFFVLTKEQMAEEAALCGSYTHGTTSANEANENREYSITIPVYSERSEKTKRWREKYLSEELKERVLGKAS
jgi:uncharacterized CHY-type Zn-finger protein